MKNGPIVIPAKAGIKKVSSSRCYALGSGLRRNDGVFIFFPGRPRPLTILSASDESGEAVPTQQMFHFVQHDNAALG